MYISEAAIGVGAAPSVLNMSTQILVGGVRIFRPSRSATVRIGLVEVVIWRKPFTHGRSKVTKPLSSICLRTSAPSGPSKAARAWAWFLNAKPMPSIPASGATLAKMPP